MAYFPTDTGLNLFLFSKVYPKCISEFQPNMENASYTFFNEKVILYDNKIKETLDNTVYKIIKTIDNYYKNNDKDSNYNNYENIRKKIMDLKDIDKNFFQNISKNLNYYIDGAYAPVDYIEVINQFQDDFNTNYFEYYLMAQHIEQYSCCFLYTFRQISIFSSRVLNCKFFYCNFDVGIKNYIDKINSLIFKYTEVKDDNGKPTGEWKIDNSDQINDDIDYLNNYLVYRNDFINDLSNFYYNIYEIIEPLWQFFIRMKAILKILAISNIIVNSHADDTELFKNQLNSIINFTTQGDIAQSPPLFQSFYKNIIYVYSRSVFPNLIDMKAAMDKKKLSLDKKEKFKRILILYALAATSMITYCQDLYSNLTSFNLSFKNDKKDYFKDSTAKEKKDFQKDAILPHGLNMCYVIDFDNPPDPADYQDS